VKMIGRLFGLLLFGWFSAMGAAAGIALQRKRDAPPPPDPGADEIDLVAAFEPVDFRSTSGAFRGGNVEVWFAGGSIDLRGATLAPGGATLRLTTVFGGGQLLVPEAWRVTTHLVGVGGVGDVRQASTDLDAPHLTLEGPVAFGGWGIMSHDPQTEAVPTA
jgi:hypothetical protein